MHCGPNDPNGIDSNKHGVDFDLASCVLAASGRGHCKEKPNFFRWTFSWSDRPWNTWKSWNVLEGVTCSVSLWAILPGRCFLGGRHQNGRLHVHGECYAKKKRGIWGVVWKHGTIFHHFPSFSIIFMGLSSQINAMLAIIIFHHSPLEMSTIFRPALWMCINELTGAAQFFPMGQLDVHRSQTFGGQLMEKQSCQFILSATRFPQPPSSSRCIVSSFDRCFSWQWADFGFWISTIFINKKYSQNIFIWYHMIPINSKLWQTHIIHRIQQLQPTA